MEALRKFFTGRPSEEEQSVHDLYERNGISENLRDVKINERTWKRGGKTEILIIEMDDEYLDSAVKNCILSHLRLIKPLNHSERQAELMKLTSIYQAFWMIEELTRRGKPLAELEERYRHYQSLKKRKILGRLAS